LGHKVSPNDPASKHWSILSRMTQSLQHSSAKKNIKHWSHEWKIDLIVASNPDWRDLYDDIVR
jgi:predicted GIY-YIG superfamily endonuclease